MAGRILGMGDVLTLIEQAEQAFEKEQAEEAAAKLLEGQFTLDDFLEQMQQLKKMGPLGSLLGMMPGMPKELKGAKIGDDDLKPVEAIIRSMTLRGAGEARRSSTAPAHPHRHRLGHVAVSDVNRLVKQFGEMQKMMKRFGMAGKPARRARSAGRRASSAGSVPGCPVAMPDLAELMGGSAACPGVPGGFPGPRR